MVGLHCHLFVLDCVQGNDVTDQTETPTTQGFDVIWRACIVPQGCAQIENTLTDQILGNMQAWSNLRQNFSFA